VEAPLRTFKALAVTWPVESANTGTAVQRLSTRVPPMIASFRLLILKFLLEQVVRFLALRDPDPSNGSQGSCLPDIITKIFQMLQKCFARHEAHYMGFPEWSQYSKNSINTKIIVWFA
jgi:hypothetical protein